MKKRGDTVVEVIFVLAIMILVAIMLMPKPDRDTISNNPVAYVQKHGLKSVVSKVWNGSENTSTNK